MSREALSPVDAAWLRMEHPTNLMMITSVMTLAEPVTIDEFKTTVGERIQRFDRFRQRVVDPMGTPQWEDDPHFDLNAHIHRIALPRPGGQAELQELVSDLMTMPLDPNKPLWHFYLVEGYQDGCAVITRLHHAIADGIALIYVMLSMADPSESAPPPPPASDHDDEVHLTDLFRPALKAATTVWHEGVDLLRHPSSLFDRALQGLDLAGVVGKLALQGSDSETVLKGDLGVCKRAAWSAPYPLADVKAIKKAIGGTVNDVLMNALAGALRRYLIARDEPVDDVEIRAVVPVNLRPIEEAYKLGNHFGLVFFTFPVGIEDPLVRLEEVRRRMGDIKGSMEAGVTFGLLQAMGKSPEEVKKLMIRIFSAMATAVMTNVPGPREPLYFAGRKIEHMMFWVPRAGEIGMGVSILSYAGEILLGIASDVGLVADPDALVAAFIEELHTLKQLAQVKS